MTVLDHFAPARLPDTLEALDTELAERSLHEFIRQMWSRMDPADYVDGWHLRVICEHLEAVCAGEIRRLVINIPPRAMKSLTVAVALPAWTWARRSDDPLSGPDTSFVFASYAHSLSIRDSRKCRQLIQSDLYQKRWGDRFELVDDQRSKIRYETNKMGYRLATSVGGSLTGEGADIIVVDDAHKADEAESEVKREAVLEWWKSAMSNRLNSPTAGAFIVVMQRLHQSDLTGYLVDREREEWMEEVGEWEHLVLPARYERDHPYVSIHDMRTEDGELLWPERFSEAYLQERQSEMGSYGFAGQYQQRPAPREGGMFDSSWWKYVDAVPADALKMRIWDLAATQDGGDWTVGLLLGFKDGIWYGEDVKRKQLSPHGVQRLITTTAEQDGKGVSILIAQEGGAAGVNDVFTWSKLLVGYDVRFHKETGDKAIRARGVSAQVEAGNVYLLRAPWNKAFVDELALFPDHGDHDDQADTLSGGFNYMQQNLARRPAVTATAPWWAEDGGDW